MADQRVRDFGIQAAYDENAYLWLDKAGWTEARKILASTLVAGGGGGGGTPGGADTQVQFNESGSFGGDAEFVWDTAGKALTLSATGTATLVIQQAGGGDEVVVIDTTNKRTKLNNADGTVTLDGPVTFGTAFHVLQDSGGSDLLTAVFSAIDVDENAFGAFFLSTSARGTAAAPAIVEDEDVVFLFSMMGYDGANYSEVASIQAVVNGDPGEGDMPGKLVFATTADGDSSSTEQIEIYANGRTLIQTGGGTPSGKVHISQNDGSGAIPVLYLDQDDVSEEWFEFDTTIGVGNATEAVGAKEFTPTHFLKITLTGVGTKYLVAGDIAE